MGSNTRPILELEEKGSGNILHVFMTGTRTAGTSGQSGGDIFEKTSPVSSISFPSGLGTTVIRDDASAKMNNVTSTKQNINSTSGVVVLAFNDTTDFYWHNRETLGGGAPQDPQAAFTAAPSSGPATLNVQFTNTSTGTGPLTYAWDFDNDGVGRRHEHQPEPPVHEPGHLHGQADGHRDQRLQLDDPADPGRPAGRPDRDVHAGCRCLRQERLLGRLELRRHG